MMIGPRRGLPGAPRVHLTEEEIDQTRGSRRGLDQYQPPDEGWDVRRLLRHGARLKP